MGRDLAAAYPAARHAFDCVDQALGVPVSRIAFEGPPQVLTRTDIAQPALLAHGAAVWAVTRETLARHVRAAAGHSLGEFTAYYAAEALPLTSAAKLVRARGELMHRAGEDRPGAMAAIIGHLSVRIDDICRQSSAEAGEVVAANYNGPEQTVVSGEVAGVEHLMALAKARGAKRVIRLPVAGAFHSPLMQPSVPGLRAALDAAGLSDPRVPVYANVDAQPIRTAQRARETLLRQLTEPVRWVELVRNMAAAYPTALFVEMGPGSVLSGLVKRIAPQLATLACGAPADIDRVIERVHAN
jgi:[acyl-carrier-protein] S-malonyltransferase